MHVARLIVGLLPSSQLKIRLLNALGYRIHRTARIDPVILANVRRLSIGPGSHLRPFSTFRDMKEISIGVGAIFGSWNWTSSAPYFHQYSEGAGTLHIGDHVAITSRHYMDASGGIAIGDHCTIAGQRTTILTHGIDVQAGRQTISPVTIKPHVIVGSNCNIVPGADLPERTFFAMGSTITKGLTEPSALYAGTPAVIKRFLPPTSMYFHKTTATVD